jgi:chromosome segregation ATPase
MWLNGRRCIIHAWHSAREQFAALVAERDQLRRENDELKRQFDWMLRELQDVTSAFRELRMAVLARQHAERELASLYREREIARAQAAERDPAQPLQ